VTSSSLHTEAQARYAYLVRHIQRLLPAPARIVELGAAPGDQIAALADMGYATTAVDIGISSDGWADGTEGRMARLFADHGVEYVEWDMEQTPYPLEDASFDGVVYTEVFEHLRDFPVRSLEECARVLRPGGYLFFTTPNAAYLMNRVRLLRGRSVYTPLHDWIGGVPHARHAREYLWPEVHEALRIAGLEVVFETSRHFHLGDPSPVRRLVKRGLDRLARARKTLGPQIVIVARRPATRGQPSRLS
jgi:SAM-dependent methyltransferase